MHSMKAKKLSAILLAFCLGTGGIAGCGTGDEVKTTEQEAESNTSQEDGDILHSCGKRKSHYLLTQ